MIISRPIFSMQNPKSTKAVKVIKTGVNILARRVWVNFAQYPVENSMALKHRSESLGVNFLNLVG